MQCCNVYVLFMQVSFSLIALPSTGISVPELAFVYVKLRMNDLQELPLSRPQLGGRLAFHWTSALAHHGSLPIHRTRQSRFELVEKIGEGDSMESPKAYNAGLKQ